MDQKVEKPLAEEVTVAAGKGLTTGGIGTIDYDSEEPEQPEIYTVG